MALPCEHGHGMMEDVASTLNTLVEPTGSMSFFVDRNREGLPSTVIDGVDEGNIKSIAVLSQVVGT